MLNGKIIQKIFIQMNIIFGKEREKYFTHIMLKQINESLLNMVTHTMNASLALKAMLAILQLLSCSISVAQILSQANKSVMIFIINFLTKNFMKIRTVL